MEDFKVDNKLANWIAHNAEPDEIDKWNRLVEQFVGMRELVIATNPRCVQCGALAVTVDGYYDASCVECSDAGK